MGQIEKDEDAAWDGDGMVEDEDEIGYALEILGLFPDEITALADYARRETWIFEQMAKHNDDEDRKTRLVEIAAFWKRRARKWKGLSARVEQEMTQDAEEDEQEEICS